MDSTKAMEHVHKSDNGKIFTHTHKNAEGHLEAVKRMVEDERDCSEVLIQLAAVISALNGVSKIILQEHIEGCIVEAIECGDKRPIEDLNKAIAQFIK